MVNNPCKCHAVSGTVLTKQSQGSHFAIDPFIQQEIHCDEGMDLHAGLLTCLSNFKRLSGTI